MKYKKQEEVLEPVFAEVVEEQPQAAVAIKKEKKKHNLLPLAIIAIFIAVAAVIAYPLVFQNLSGLADGLFNAMFTQFLPNLWKAMVRELFTFVFWLLAAFFMFIGITIAVLTLVATGPFFCGIALILGIIAAAAGKKWHGFMALGITFVCAVISVIIFFVNTTH